MDVDWCRRETQIPRLGYFHWTSSTSLLPGQTAAPCRPGTNQLLIDRVIDWPIDWLFENNWKSRYQFSYTRHRHTNLNSHGCELNVSAVQSVRCLYLALLEAENTNSTHFNRTFIFLSRSYSSLSFYSVFWRLRKLTAEGEWKTTTNATTLMKRTCR